MNQYKKIAATIRRHHLVVVNPENLDEFRTFGKGQQVSHPVGWLPLGMLSGRRVTAADVKAEIDHFKKRGFDPDYLSPAEMREF